MFNKFRSLFAVDSSGDTKKSGKVEKLLPTVGSPGLNSLPEHDNGHCSGLLENYNRLVAHK